MAEARNRAGRDWFESTLASRHGTIVLLGALVIVTLYVKTSLPIDENAVRADEGAAGKSRSSTATTQGKELFDGKTLAGWKVTEFGGEGDVEAKDGRIQMAMAEGCTGITWKGEFPKWDYEVRLEAMRVEGIDFFCGMTFPVGDDPCSLIVGGWGGAVVGLSSIDGKDAAHNETKRYEKFETGRWYKIRLKVTKEKIEAWIDDKQVVDQALAGHKISIRPEVQLSRPFGIAAWRTTAALRDIRLVSLPK